jgi:outer membrane protein OmpA-like peptidoglycan-associated protein
VKAGDYFYATRTYEDSLHNEGDNPSFHATMQDDTQDHPPTFSTLRIHELPRRALAEMMVLHTTPKSSTAIITYAIEEVLVGDWAEAFEPPPPPVVAAPEPMPPVISCAASPATVRKGEGSLITCEATSPDNHPLSISFSTSAGNLTPRDNTANLDTASAEPGAITVTGTATDDRNLSSNAAATVNVEALPANPEPTNQVIQFKKGSARVDNAAKAVLDGVALQLNQAADANSTVVGHSQKGEAKSLATARANNIKRYLTQKGIDGKRIGTKSGEPASSTGDVWVVPSGATPPGEEAPKP